jgi:hypothetical protein
VLAVLILLERQEGGREPVTAVIPRVEAVYTLTELC